MSRSLVLGNGNIFIALDHHAQVQDLYFPYVGLENHLLSGCVHRVGVWVDDAMLWFDGPGWVFDINYQHETLSSNIRAVHAERELELNFTDVVYNESNIFLRYVTVTNKAKRKRTIKLFFNHQFHIKEDVIGNTAYYDPSDAAIVHYKGRRVFLVSGMKGYEPFDDYSVGHFNLLGKEGTWKDAEDGVLDKNAIEHGAVDSVIGFSEDVPAERAFVVKYWMTIAETVEAAKKLQAYVLEKSPEHLMQTAQDFWYAWVNKQNFSFYGLGKDEISLFKKSLLIIRTHVDENGSILASGDTSTMQYGLDTYAYMWPRDGAMAAIALDLGGYYDLTRTFFKFCDDVTSSDGFLYHKYTADKSLGSSWHPWIKDGKQRIPIQEDETALVLYAFWKHYEASRDLEFVEHIYNSFIKKAANFLVSFRNPKTKLPYPSYDIWEEKFGISTFTCASVFGALEAATRFAHVLGKKQDESRFKTAALEVKRGILKYLYSADEGIFYKLIQIADDGTVTYDRTLDISSFYGIFNFGVLEIDDPRLTKFYDIIEARLSCKKTVGGFARYENDGYYREEGTDFPGNPWIITTLWIAQYHIARAKKEQDLQVVRDYLAWTVNVAYRSGVLSEQLNYFTGEQISVAPLTWSHAEYVQTVIKYLEKLEDMGITKVSYPAKSL